MSLLFRNKKKETVRAKHLFLNISTMCNMSCSVCYNHLFKCTNQRMDLTTAQKATDFYFKNKEKEYSGHYIMFFGGEPLTNLNMIPEYLRWFRKKYADFECDFHIFTNGLLLDKSIVDFLLSQGITVFVSYDSCFEGYSKRKSNSKEDYNYLRYIIDYMIEKKPDLVIPYYIIDETNINKLNQFYLDVSKMKATRVAITRKFFTAWSKKDIDLVKEISIEHKNENKFKILVFPEIESRCDNCKTNNIMIYPNGDIYDLCVVSASSMIVDGIRPKASISKFHFGNIKTVSKLKIDLSAKREVIHEKNDKGINTYCPTIGDYDFVYKLAE